MDTNKKLEMLETEFILTINHATKVLEEYVNTLTEKILVDAFNELSVEDQMLVLLGMVCETQPEVEKNKLDYTWEALKQRSNPPYSYDIKVIEALLRMEGIKL